MHNNRNDTDDSKSFVYLDATAQGELVRSGEVSAPELVEAAITRIERLNPRINALASTNFELARERAAALHGTGVFTGVPTLLKDLLSYPEHRFELGSRLFEGQVAQSGSAYTDALDAAGLVVLGKSTTSELGLLGTTETAAAGPTRNPWNLDLSTGGSSGGAVAAVASGMVPIAHASDGGGSIRGPASFCGLFGFKPSRGRTVFAGIPEEVPTARLISDHCVSRSVRDSAAWLAATERPDLAERLPSPETLARGPGRQLRIGVCREDCFGRPPEAAADAALEGAVALCWNLGHQVIEALNPVTAVHASENSDAFFALSGAVLSGLLDQVKQAMGDGFDETLLEPFTREIVHRARALPSDAFPTAIATLAKAEHAASTAAAQWDVLLSPTVPIEQFAIGAHGPDTDADDLINLTNRLAGYTVVPSLAGWPAMSVPLHWTEKGMPVGCHFAARHGQDALLLALACQLEVTAPWHPRLTALADRLICHSA